MACCRLRANMPPFATSRRGAGSPASPHPHRATQHRPTEQDSFRKFKGPDGYSRLNFVATNVQSAAVTVDSLRMLDGSTAEIRWHLTGKLGVLPIDVAGVCVCVC